MYFGKRTDNAISIGKGLQTQELCTREAAIFPVKWADCRSGLRGQGPRWPPLGEL
jgi:hypothetical protein